METLRQRRLWWIALTLPLPFAALAVYSLSEWIFFVTKPSVLSALGWSDRLAIIVQTPVPFIPAIFAAQCAATLLSIAAFRHLRGAAVLPAGLLLGCLGLILIDNFTHTVFGFSSTNVDVRLRYFYAVLLLILVTAASHRLYGFLDARTARSALRSAAALALIALPSFVAFAIAEANRPRVGPLLSLTAAPRREGTLPNVLFLTVDGVEARQLSAYDSIRSTTPFLHSLRNETLFCENAFANACRTYGSLVVLLTGKRPTSTHVLDPPSMLEDRARDEHLPGILKKHGYTTLQLTMKHYADAADANLVGAFDLANYDWEGFRLARVEHATDAARVFRLQVLDRLQDRLARIFAARDRDSFAVVIGKRKPSFWSDERRVKTLLRFMAETDEPWFAQVHLLDTHLTDEETDPDARLGEADDRIQAVFAALRASGQLDRTIVAISSDHGRAWQTRERIPLMIRFPHARHARRETNNAQTADIAPTTLDALGMPIPPWMDGRSLLRPLPADRSIVALCGADANLHSTQADKLRVPNFGTASAMIVTGSWWYEMQLGHDMAQAGFVTGHTVPAAQPAPAVARATLERELISGGFILQK